MQCEYIGPDAPHGCETEAIWLVINVPSGVAPQQRQTCDTHVVHFLGQSNTVRAIH